MEIERKFLVKDLPDLSAISPLHYERYYLQSENGIEERIQKINEQYSYEKKTIVDTLTCSTELKEIPKEEFEQLKINSSKAILRDSYTLTPNLSIKIYRGEYAGLIRAEVEFSSVDEARSYIPKSWMGSEITNTPLGRDARLLNLDAPSMQKLIQQPIQI